MLQILKSSHMWFARDDFVYIDPIHCIIVNDNYRIGSSGKGGQGREGFSSKGLSVTFIRMGWLFAHRPGYFGYGKQETHLLADVLV